MGPGIGSARSKKRWSSIWQKYWLRKSSWRQTICAPLGGGLPDTGDRLRDVRVRVGRAAQLDQAEGHGSVAGCVHAGEDNERAVPGQRPGVIQVTRRPCVTGRGDRRRASIASHDTILALGKGRGNDGLCLARGLGSWPSGDALGQAPGDAAAGRLRRRSRCGPGEAVADSVATVDTATTVPAAPTRGHGRRA